MGNEQRATYFTKEQLQSLIGPRTRDVYDAIRVNGEMSATEIQTKLGFESKSVYYQIKKLLAVGLLSEAESIKGRATVYRVADGRGAKPEPTLHPEFETLAAKSVAAQLRKSNRHYSRVAAMAKSRPELLELTYIETSRVEIPRRNLTILKQRYAELLAEMQACDCDEEVVAIHTLFLFSPEVSAKERNA